MTITRIWAKHGIKPHRLERLFDVERSRLRRQGCRRDRPIFESAAERGVFCFDEKTAIQALDRKDPVRAFLTDIVASQPKRKEIHVIADNLSAHRTKLVIAFLDPHPNVHMHFTPTYSSWLNQVE